MTQLPETQQKVKFYQTGTFTVGNRLLDDAGRSVQSTIERANALDSGHRACQGCGEALGARYVVDAALRAGRRNVPEPSNSQDLGLKIGDDVEHPAFGEGVIIGISGEGDKAEAVINFAGAGTKHLALAWAPLKKL